MIANKIPYYVCTGNYCYDHSRESKYYDYEPAFIAFITRKFTGIKLRGDLPSLRYKMYDDVINGADIILYSSRTYAYQVCIDCDIFERFNISNVGSRLDVLWLWLVETYNAEIVVDDNELVTVCNI